MAIDYRLRSMKRAIVIGATSGIGRGLSKILVDIGYLVGITGRRTELLNEIKQEKPDSYIISTFDVRDFENIPSFLNDLILQLGGLDLLVFNSGVGERMDEPDFQKEKRILDTNVMGFTCVIDWAFSFYKKQGYGHLVAISSIAGLRGNRWASSYSASKAYQINYLEGLSHKAQKMKQRIYITDIRPGFVDTVMAQGDNVFWVASVEKASRQMYRAIRRRKKIAYITKRWRFLAGIMKIIPRWIYIHI